jgi:uncharacterized membrane protein
MYINVSLIVAYSANFAWRYRSSARGPVDARMMALSAACVLALCVSGYLGGKLTYRYGVRVATETAQADGYLTEGQNAAAAPRPRRARRTHRA